MRARAFIYCLWLFHANMTEQCVREEFASQLLPATLHRLNSRLDEFTVSCIHFYLAFFFCSFLCGWKSEKWKCKKMRLILFVVEVAPGPMNIQSFTWDARYIMGSIIWSHCNDRSSMLIGIKWTFCDGLCRYTGLGISRLGHSRVRRRQLDVPYKASSRGYARGPG